MDTDAKYRNDPALDVELTANAPDKWLGDAPDIDRTTTLTSDDVPIDGQVTFLFSHPEKPPSGREDGRWKVGTFPFRDAAKDGQWFANPDADDWKRRPVWKWQNPTADPYENLTLKPSIGLKGGDEITFHIWVKGGEIEFV